MLSDFGSRESARRRSIAGELGVLALVGLFLGVIGPFGTDEAPVVAKMLYWLANIVGGGAIGIVIDRLLEPRIPSPWPRVLAVSVAMTPPVTLFVIGNAALFFGYAPSIKVYVELLWQVFAIALPVMVVRLLAWKQPLTIVRTQRIVAPPLPQAEARFRSRLSAKNRAARLRAVEAHDHYVRVHTDAGTELVTMRFADAMEELSEAYGFRVHRSWWVAGEAIEQARWSRASGEVRIEGGCVAPISRSGAPILRDAGWL